MKTRRMGAETFRRAFPHARSMWAVNVPAVGTLEAFWLGKALVIVQDYASRDGWQIFTPTTDDGRIDATLDAVSARCEAVRADVLGDVAPMVVD